MTVSKNYLAEKEIRELNRLTTILLDIFEDQADLGRLLVMADARRLLDDQLTGLGRVVLRSGGRVSNEAAKEKALREFEVWKGRQKAVRHAEADASISELANAVRRSKRDT